MASERKIESASVCSLGWKRKKQCLCLVDSKRMKTVVLQRVICSKNIDITREENLERKGMLLYRMLLLRLRTKKSSEEKRSFC